MNILFTHEIPYQRDPVWEWHQLADLLSLRGHNVYAIDYGATRYQEMDIARVYPGAKVHLIRPPSFGLGRLGYGFLYYVVVDKVLQERKIDAVILYSAPTNGVQTILAAKRSEIPVIFRSIDVLHKLSPKWLSLPTKWAERWVHRHVDKILTITPALSHYVVSLGADPDKVRLLPLGIDLDHSSDAPESKSGGSMWSASSIYPTMVFAGTLLPFSGLPDLIKRMPGLVARIPNLRLLIVGDGVQRLELERLIRELGLGECIKITGMAPHEDVPKWIAGADIGVLTFPAEEATRDIFPTKVLQYMSCSKPVVSNPLCGLLEMGIGREQGVVYVKDNDWGTAVQLALAGKAELGAKARKYVIGNHSYDKVIEQLEREVEMQLRTR